MVGASNDPRRPSSGVFRDLRAAGYDVVPVNPNATDVDGRPCYPTVTAAVEATGRVDIVDVFRRAGLPRAGARGRGGRGALPVAAAGDRVRAAGQLAHEAGLAVVMDRCTIVEVRRLAAR